MFMNRSNRHRNSVIMSPASLSWWFKWEMGSGHMQQLCTHITFVKNSVIGRQGVYWCELENAASGAEVQLTCVHLALVVFRRWEVNESAVESRPAFLKKSEQLAYDFKSASEKQKRRQAKAGERQTTNKNPSRTPNRGVGCAEAGQEGSSCSTSRD